MSATTTELFRFDNSFVRDLPEMYIGWEAAAAPAPRLLVANDALAVELGLDPASLHSPEGVAVLAGNAVPSGAAPVAMVYAGHQFGGYAPRLGDGRALLLGEVVDAHGRRRDVHLKGSGATPFARGGDGKAAVGPMLRELLVGEAMHALGVPTTRALAVVATGEHIARDGGMLPGAVLTRIAASHLRVGTFEYAARLGDREILRRLAEYAIARHHPEASQHERPALAFYERVVEAQASLVARWMLVGFIHGVMNTDNMTISGETIDYGPCAFMDAYDPATVYSSIDHGGRYAYGRQPAIAQWNLARLGESLLPLIDDDSELAVAAATDVLMSFGDRFQRHLMEGMRTKLGLVTSEEGDPDLVDELLTALHHGNVDYTSFFRALGAVVAGEADALATVAAAGELQPWLNSWRSRLALEGRDPQAVAAGMDAVNPVYVPRNHLVEEALESASGGELEPFERLLDAVRQPFHARNGLERYAEPAPATFARYYQTFCGT